MSRNKKAMVLGYTRAGHAVLLPIHQTPDMVKFVAWTPGDHLDAWRILREHGERSAEPIGSWCARWASAHHAIGKSARRSRQKLRRSTVRGAAEAIILSGRIKR
jgi:hypothetical protein